MKATLCLGAVVLAINGAVAFAQTTTTSSTISRVIVPGDSRSPYAYPNGYDHASTIAEGYARGLGDVIRSEGIYNLYSSAAAINLTEADRQDIENQKQWTQAYFDIRNINKQQFDADMKRHRGTSEDWIRYAQAGMPKRLGPSELDSVTGEIHWPILLTSRLYSAIRAELEKAFADRAYHGVMGSETFLKVAQLVDDMLSSLRERIRAVPADQYVTAKRFLLSLAYEASQPAG
jgi:hypothetical protein